MFWPGLYYILVVLSCLGKCLFLVHVHLYQLCIICCNMLWKCHELFVGSGLHSFLNPLLFF